MIDDSMMADQVTVNAEWLAELQREHDAMQHDTARMMDREAEMATEIDRLREALKEIRALQGENTVAYRIADRALAEQGGD